jgi:hypothetical protein
LREAGLEEGGQFAGEKAGAAPRLPGNGNGVDEVRFAAAGRLGRLKLRFDESDTVIEVGCCFHKSPV